MLEERVHTIVAAVTVTVGSLLYREGTAIANTATPGVLEQMPVVTLSGHGKP